MIDAVAANSVEDHEASLRSMQWFCERMLLEDLEAASGVKS